MIFLSCVFFKDEFNSFWCLITYFFVLSISVAFFYTKTNKKLVSRIWLFYKISRTNSCSSHLNHLEWWTKLLYRTSCKQTKDRETDVAIRFRYFHLAFERIFSDLPFLKLLRHKTRTFGAYVEKERKKEKERKPPSFHHINAVFRTALKTSFYSILK